MTTGPWPPSLVAGQTWHDSATNESYIWSGSDWIKVDSLPSLSPSTVGMIQFDVVVAPSDCTFENNPDLLEQISDLTLDWFNSVVDFAEIKGHTLSWLDGASSAPSFMILQNHLELALKTPITVKKVEIWKDFATIKTKIGVVVNMKQTDIDSYVDPYLRELLR